MTVDILGAAWTIHILSADEDSKLRDCGGYTDWSTRTIVVRLIEPDENSLEDLSVYQRKVLRHEIIHAFLYESGLGDDTNFATAWAANEEMVDWMAFQGPKIVSAWKAVGAL